MGEVKLNMLLLGKTGNGKSATANMIINKRVNRISCNSTSETKEVDFSFAQYNNYVLLVVDGPGLEDTDRTADTDKEEAAKNMATALAMCYGGVDAFLFVFRFGNRMTREERAALDSLKQIFGKCFMKNVIVVVTYGDQFHSNIKEEGRNLTFNNWCKEQTGEFKQLLQDCDDRVVLFNNRETDVDKKRAQIGQIVELTHNLQIKSGRYTSLYFQIAERERKILILNLKAPHLEREFQEKMSNLIREIDNLSATSTNRDKEKVKNRVMDLKHEIKNQYEDCDVLRDLLSLMDDMERCLNDVEQLIYLNGKFEEIRRAKAFWTWLKVCEIFQNPIFVGLESPREKKSNDGIVDTRLSDLSTKQKKIEQQMDEIEKQRIKLGPTTKQDDQKGGQKEESCHLL